MSNQLNPADQFTLMMDQEIRSSGMAGNNCGIVLELDGVIDEEDVKQKCQAFAKKFPRSVARLFQKGRHYYWKDSRQTALPVFFYKPDALQSPDFDRHRKFLDIINTSVSLFDSAPVEIHVIIEAGQSFVMLRWFHPVCDAKGAELVLHHIFNPGKELPDSGDLIIESMLKKWTLWEKIKYTWKAFSMIRSMEKHPSVLPLLSESADRKPGLRRIVLNREDSDKVMSLAIKNTGIAGISLYFIGCMMRAMELAGNDNEGQAYCVPYAVNYRRSRALVPVFGNQISFVFTRAEKQLVQARETLFPYLREQHKQTIKNRHDYAMLPLMQLASWLPLKRQGEIVRCTPDGRERSSFWFSYTGNVDPEPEHLAGLPVTNMYHLCQVTSPPAMAVLVSKFQGKIVLSFNYIESQCDPDWIDSVVKIMTAELRGQ